MKKFNIPASIQITLLYLLFGGLWILFSDMILESFVHDTRELTRMQNFKGWFYVLISGLLIYSLIHQYIRRQEQILTQLKENEEQLLLAISISRQGVFELNIENGHITLKDVPEISAAPEARISIIHLMDLSSRIHPDDLQRVTEAYRDYFAGKTSQLLVEARNMDDAGQWRWMLVIGSFVDRENPSLPLRMIGIFMDITEKKEDELYKARLLTDARRRLERITSLHEIDREISTSLDLSSTLNLICLNVKQHLYVDSVSILLFNEKTDLFEYAYGIGFETSRIRNATVKMGYSLAGIAAQEKKLIHIRDLQKKNLDEAFASLLAEERVKNYLGIPLLAKNKLVGVLELFTRDDIEPDKEWLEFFETLAGQAALAIENAQLIEGLENVNQDLYQLNEDLINANRNLTASYDATIESLAMALSLRDDETEGHSRRVTTMMAELAERMNFSAEDRINIHRGTLLHDIGKIGVPDAILHKPGILTQEEREAMQQHPLFAYNLLKSIDYLKPALDIPHLHHEKWDGTGYPHGLSGENIPLPARLFAVVDVYDALTSDRPYRKAWSRENAIAYIHDQSGSHFDPDIVKIFLSYLQQKPDL